MRRIVAGVLAALLAALLAVPALGAGEQPAAWAQAAVDFAVENGLLSGDDLRPGEQATRAEFASMVARLLDVQTAADLSGYSDVSQAEWYYIDLARAVAVGVFQGDGGKLNPNRALTREQAMAVLARCFGVPDGDAAALAAFRDGGSVSDWAVGSVAGMAAEGYVRGSGGRLNPQGTITRQELAQLLYNLAGAVVRGGDVPQTGNVTLLAGETLPSNCTVEGDLFLGCNFAGEVVLQNVRVRGRLVLHGGAVRLTGNSSASEIVCGGGNTELTTQGGAAIRTAAGESVISGGGTVKALAPATLRGGVYPSLVVSGAAVTVEEGARVDEASLEGKHSRLTGTGSVARAVIRQKDCAVETAGTEITEAVDQGLGQVTITAASPANEPTPAAPEIRTTVRFDQVDTANGPGADEGVRYCTLAWYVDGVLAQKDHKFPLAEGATASFTAQADYTGRVRPTRTILVRLTCGDESRELSQTVNQHIEQLSTPVRTLEVEATVLRDTQLYGYSDLTGWTGSVKAGERAIYDNYAGKSAGRIRLSDGRSGWVRWSDLQISSKDYVQYTDYTEVQKENFVNIQGYESTTRYLVWISLLTQKVNVFEGAQSDWRLLHTFSCCTGKNTTPTIGGVFQYQYRNNYWDFDYYIVKRPMIFNGGHAFHTRTYVKSTGAILDPTIGRPASNGCVRMYDEDVNWLWDNMPFGTTVVVY